MTLSNREAHLLYDKRMAKRFELNGELSAKERKKHLQTLPDLADDKIEVPAYEEAAPAMASDADAEPTFEAAE